MMNCCVLSFVFFVYFLFLSLWSNFEALRLYNEVWIELKLCLFLFCSSSWFFIKPGPCEIQNNLWLTFESFNISCLIESCLLVFLSFYSSPLNIMWLTYKMSVSPGSSLSSRVKLSTWHLTEVWWSLETDKVTFRDAALWSCDAAAHVGFNTTCGQWRHHQRAPAGGSMLWSSVGTHSSLNVTKCQYVC